MVADDPTSPKPVTSILLACVGDDGRDPFALVVEGASAEVDELISDLRSRIRHDVYDSAPHTVEEARDRLAPWLREPTESAEQIQERRAADAQAVWDSLEAGRLEGHVGLTPDGRAGHQHLDNIERRIDDGLTRGILTPDQADHLRGLVAGKRGEIKP